MSKFVRILKYALDDTPEGIVLRGHVDPNSLELLKVDNYQREVLQKTTKKIRKAFDEGKTLPDIELGMRGQRFQEKDEVIYLQDPVYIIDGQQRVTAAIEQFEEGEIPYLGCVVHFDTSEEWERERFKALNQERTKLSPSVLLRNLRHDYPAIALIYRLTTQEEKFVMFQRVAWEQVMHRQELMTASVFATALQILHSYSIRSEGLRANIEKVAQNLQKISESISEDAFETNIKRFFGLIEESWGIRSIAYVNLATQLKGSFVYTLAKIMNDHANFWDGNYLVVDPKMLKKISQFPIADPQVRQIIASSGNVNSILYSLMIEHINKGRKQTDRLQRRRGGTESELMEIMENPE